MQDAESYDVLGGRWEGCGQVLLVDVISMLWSSKVPGGQYKYQEDVFVMDTLPILVVTVKIGLNVRTSTTGLSHGLP